MNKKNLNNEFIKLFGPAVDIREKLFNTLALAGFLICLTTAIITIINHGTTMTVIINLLAGILSISLLVFTRKTRMFNIAYFTTVIAVFVIVFSILFFQGGAYKSGMPSYFIFAIVFTVYMLSGTLLYVALSIETVVYIFDFLLAYYSPETVAWLSSERSLFVDSLTCCIIVSFVLGITMSLNFSLYRKQQKHLEEIKENATKANEEKTTFLLNMSHEIRTPINVILGMNEMILRDPNSPNVEPYSHKIKKAGDLLQTLVNNTIDISQIESGKMDLINEPFQFSMLIKEVNILAEYSCQEKNLKYYYDYDESIPPILLGDYLKIKQIILNLINNAIKYTNKGYVKFSSTYISEDSTPSVLFSVADTGPGIKEEDYSVIWDAFERLDMRKNRNIDGVGLGLAIVQSYSRLMGGEAYFESTYGAGTTFFIKLPLKAVTEETYSELDIDPSDNLSLINMDSPTNPKKVLGGSQTFVAPNAHILIVDDKQENLEITSLLLKRTLMHVDTAISGKECIDKLSKNKYDIVLIDYLMPELDGIETINFVRKTTPDFDTPVVMMTASVLNTTVEKAKKEKFSGILSKPLSVELLENQIISLLPKDYVTLVNTKPQSDIPQPTIDHIIRSTESYGIDIPATKDLLNCGAEHYLQLINLFLKYNDESNFGIFKTLVDLQNAKTSNSKNTIDDITEKNFDFDAFVIKVHSLKSNAKSVGGLYFHTLCSVLESRGNAKDLEYIKATAQHVIILWSRLLTGLRNIKEILLNSEIIPIAKESENNIELSDMIIETETAIEKYRAREAEESLDRIISIVDNEIILKRLSYVKSLIDNLSYDEALTNFRAIVTESGMDE